MLKPYQEAINRLQAFRESIGEDAVIDAGSALTAGDLDLILKALVEHDGPLEVPRMHI